MAQRGMINRKMRKATGNPGKNAKKRRKRKNPKGEDGTSIRLGKKSNILEVLICFMGVQDKDPRNWQRN